VHGPRPNLDGDPFGDWSDRADGGLFAQAMSSLEPQT